MGIMNKGSTDRFFAHYVWQGRLQADRRSSRMYKETLFPNEEMGGLRRVLYDTPKCCQHPCNKSPSVSRMWDLRRL